MIKWLIVVGVVGAIYFFFIKKKPAVQKQNNTKNEEKKDEVQSNDMIECSTCSIYCELEDALLSNNKYYCSSECLEKAK